jgi:D-alanyl-D-alanine carboxypeptidase
MTLPGRALISVISIVVIGCSSATSPAPSPPSLPPPTAAALPSVAAIVDGPLPKQLETNLQSVLTDYVASSKAPSASATVLVPGSGIWTGVTGLADVKKSVATTADTVYASGSITKMFVAALTLLLVKDGVLGLDDPAAKWLDPAVALKANGATIRQLLGHRSGIANYTENDAILAPGKVWTPADLVALVGGPHFAPGEQFEYSNTNYLLLGLIIERAGGAKLDAQIRKRLLDPNGLSRTFVIGPEKVTPPFAHGYGLQTTLTGDLYDGSGFIPNRSLATGAWAAGDMASTPRDVAHWLYQLCSGAILGPDLTAQMLPPIGLDQYGLGIDQQSITGAGSVAGHVGAIPGYVAVAYLERGNCDVVVVMTNTDVEDLMTPMDKMFEVLARA